MGTWKCPICDSFNPDSVDECLTCGATRHGLKDVIDGTPRAVLVTCPVCNGNNALSRTICQWCGAPLPVGPAGDVGDATNPMLQPPAAGIEGVDMLVVEDFDGLEFEDDGRTDPSLQAMSPPSVTGDPGVAESVPASWQGGPSTGAQGRPKAGRETRSCFTCGISLEPDEWVLVAGPRILCRACFHEEFGAGRKEEDAPGDIQATKSDPGEPDAPGMDVEGETGAGGVGWFVSGAILMVLGLVVTMMVGFVWGFTPMAGGLILGAVGLFQRVSRGLPRPTDSPKIQAGRTGRSP